MKREKKETRLIRTFAITDVISGGSTSRDCHLCFKATKTRHKTKRRRYQTEWRPLLSPALHFSWPRHQPSNYTHEMQCGWMFSRYSRLGDGISKSLP